MDRNDQGSQVYNSQIKPDQPMQVIELRGVQRSRIRCEGCAEGEPDWAQIQASRQALPRAEGDAMTRLGDAAGSLFDQPEADHKEPNP